MAGILDMLGNTDVLGTRQKAQDRLAAKRTDLIERLSSNAPSGRAEAGGAVGAALGQALGAGAAAALGITPVDAEVTKAEANAKLAQEIQALSQGEGAPAVGTAAHATLAGQAAQRAGRTDLGLQFAERAATLRVEETDKATALQQAADDRELKEWNGLPSDTKNAAIIADPNKLVKFGNVSREVAEATAKDLKEQRDTAKVKALKDAQDVEQALNTQLGGSGAEETADTLTNLGILSTTAGWYDDMFDSDEKEKVRLGVGSLVGSKTKQRMQAARKRGESLVETEVQHQVYRELLADGSITTNSSGQVTGFKLDNGPAPTTKARGRGQGNRSKPAPRVGSNTVQPDDDVTVDFDFSNE